MILVASANLKLFLTLRFLLFVLVLAAIVMLTQKRWLSTTSAVGKVCLHLVIAVQQCTTDTSCFISILCCSEILVEDLELFLTVHWHMMWTIKASQRIKKIFHILIFKIKDIFIWMEDVHWVGQRPWLLISECSLLLSCAFTAYMSFWHFQAGVVCLLS